MSANSLALQTKRSAIRLSVGAALATIVLKFAAYFFTDSVGLLSDAMESMVNLVGAVVALIALTIAARPADREHHYGHTKIEYFSSGLEGGLILFAAVAVMWAAIERLLNPVPLEQLNLGLIVSLAATAINYFVARRLLRVGGAEDSIVLEADGKHLMTDVVTSLGVLAGLVLVMLTDWLWLDPVIAIGVAINIIFEGSRIVRRSMDGLIDRSLTEEEESKIISAIDTTIKSVSLDVKYHGIRTRKSGSARFMEMHLLTPGSWSVTQAHDIAEEIERAIKNEFREIQTSIHIEPIEDPRAYNDSWDNG
ncbi:MAG TPA: cation diffusion facilitator family transporter [Candidatus Kapabacteria bacterium]|nr:cation diffusion facilitator family transporter [Candidatus Kapabacteria bacterium]